MSHAVEPNELAKNVAALGETPFLLYPGADGSVRANHVRVTVSPGAPEVLVKGFGRGVPAAIARDAKLSLLWPNPSQGEFSLIADGTGTILDNQTITITVHSAVLHRPAPHDEQSTSC